MIKVGTKLFVADNTGAREVKCIRILNVGRKNFASVADLIVISVTKSISSKKLKEGNVLYAVIVRSKRNLKRKNGECLKFIENSVVLLDKQREIMGTRIFGPIPREIRESNYSNIVTMAQEVV